MFEYKVFYMDSEVAEFRTIKECKDYILSRLKVDSELFIENFYIYGLIG